MDVIVYAKHGDFRSGWIVLVMDVGYDIDMIDSYNNNIVNAVGTWSDNLDIRVISR